MDFRERECAVDVETGVGETMSERVDAKPRNSIASCVCGWKLDGSNKGQNGVLPVKIEKTEKEKQRKSVRAKRPPKPPRPPRGMPLDAADQKLIKEIHELAMIKRARIDRMKALKKLKAAKESSMSSTFSGSFFAMFFTVLFFMVLIFQGMSSGNRSPRFHGTQKLSTSSMAARSKSTNMKEKRSDRFQRI
ncbi:unnamed protein product [Cuscuta campestris]|uniref:Transmembrane protein n=1 Tax=Cuscuta campestris TaxID=132261 RepID=A0A484KKY8_9ASTE|nr:unnamed protein product [Cuscuta campestris]